MAAAPAACLTGTLNRAVEFFPQHGRCELWRRIKIVRTPGGTFSSSHQLQLTQLLVHF